MKLIKISLIVVLSMAFILIAGCAPTVEEPVVEEPVVEEPEETFIFGLSNSFVGSEWRTQMLANFQQACDELGLECIVESADTDVLGQTQQIQNLIARGVDAIIVNPGDVTGLRPVIEDALEQGIIVIAVDQQIPVPGVYNVVIDQKEWAMISAEWLFEKLDGEGNVVTIEGFVGHPANEDRMEGVAEVLENFPGINVVGEDTGMWDPATAQRVAASFIASIPNLDGIWTQDGMAEGTLLAVQASGLAFEDWPQVVCEARGSGLRTWKATVEENPDFDCIAVINPPGVAYDGVYVAYYLLTGMEIDEAQLDGPYGNSLFKPIPDVVDSENLDQWIEEIADKADSYTLDELMTPEEIMGWFN